MPFVTVGLRRDAPRPTARLRCDPSLADPPRRAYACPTQWIADLNLDPLISRFDSSTAQRFDSYIFRYFMHMRAKTICGFYIMERPC